jgi:hypothetical protein
LSSPSALVVERRRLVQVADVQVHVADGGAGGHPRPRLAARGAHQVVQVERLGGHHELPLLDAPGGARPVGVHLDPQPVGVLQVERLAHPVVRRAGALADLRQVRHEAPQRGAVGEEDGEVVQPQPPRRGTGAAPGFSWSSTSGVSSPCAPSAASAPERRSTRKPSTRS